MGKIIVYKDKSSYSFSLKAANGEIIALSKIYTSKHACFNGIKSVIKNVADAHDKLLDFTSDNLRVITNPKFEVSINDDGDYIFNLRAKNGEIILYSKAYKSKLGCVNGIESVKRNALDCEIVLPAAK